MSTFNRKHESFGGKPFQENPCLYPLIGFKKTLQLLEGLTQRGWHLYHKNHPSNLHPINPGRLTAWMLVWWRTPTTTSHQTNCWWTQIINLYQVIEGPQKGIVTPISIIRRKVEVSSDSPRSGSSGPRRIASRWPEIPCTDRWYMHTQNMHYGTMWTDVHIRCAYVCVCAHVHVAYHKHLPTSNYSLLVAATKLHISWSIRTREHDYKTCTSSIDVDIYSFKCNQNHQPT